VPVLVDPARIGDYARYRGAQLIAPNRTETGLACGRNIANPADALAAGQWLRQQYGFGAAVIKLDADGLVVVNPHTEAHLPTRSRTVCDVTGAGDMVLAILGLCQAAGWTLREAAELANVAAGLEVERWGVAPVRFPEVSAELAERPRGLVTLPEMETLAEAYRRAGRTIVLTNGCFDLLHVGHVSHLEQAAELGDALVVAVNSDASVRRLKGAGHPLVGQRERMRLIASLAAVQHVLVLDEDTPHRLLERIRPDVLVKGGDYRPDEVVGHELVTAYGGSVCVTRQTEDVSTSTLVHAIQRSAVRGDIAVDDGCSPSPTSLSGSGAREHGKLTF
jgi:D-beta-D-heptose 7-phosphate kinase/D-beta-D-heptose 1-phosphate adenosyltransferase